VLHACTAGVLRQVIYQRNAVTACPHVYLRTVSTQRYIMISSLHTANSAGYTQLTRQSVRSVGSNHCRNKGSEIKIKTTLFYKSFQIKVTS